MLHSCLANVYAESSQLARGQDRMLRARKVSQPIDGRNIQYPELGRSARQHGEHQGTGACHLELIKASIEYRQPVACTALISTEGIDVSTIDEPLGRAEASLYLRDG